MSYLVIYPKRLNIQKLESDHCPGALVCDVLQYGLLVESMKTHVELNFKDSDELRFYRIRVDHMEAIPPRYAQAMPSNASSARLRSNPPAYPVSDPSRPSTRWHGTTMLMGLRPMAAPTARTADGRPICCAMSL